MRLRDPSQPVRFTIAAMAGALAVGIAGCEQQGSVERMGAEAGRSVDRAADKLQQGADTAGKAVERAGDAVRAQAAEAGKSVADAGLSAQVKSALVAAAGPTALGVDVTTRQGLVTLQGTVETAEVRDRLERAASVVNGVKSVDNQIVVARGS